MNSIGIVCEYNPFHNGHLYQINKIKQLYPDNIIICVMSGSSCERGDLSIINKWKKTECALANGVDLVVELPFVYASQAADVFCKYSLKILNELKVNKIVFGSESNNLDKIKTIANTQLLNNNYDNLVKKYLKLGCSYPNSLSNALKDLTGIYIDQPNDILGIGYVREIISNKYGIEPIVIKRTDDYNNSLTSATGIRNNLKSNIDISNYVPKDTLDKLNNLIFIEDYYTYIKYKIISEQENIIKYQSVDEKILPRILKYVNKSNSLDELILNIKSKNYTYTRLKRMFIHILFSLTKDEVKNYNHNYIRLLGLNNKGKKYLNSIKKELNIPILSTYNHKYLYIENRVNSIISLINPSEKDLEYKNNIIKKD